MVSAKCGHKEQIEIPEMSTASVNVKLTNEEKEAKDSGKTANPKNLPSGSRIGRIVKGSYGRGNVVDLDEWEAPVAVPLGKFAIVLKTQIIGRTPEGQPIEGEDEIVLKSPLLQELFRSVATYYPRLGLDGSDITIEHPYAPLFFYFDALCEAGERHPDPTCQEDLECLRQFYKKTIYPEHEIARKMVEEGMIRYPYLWALFRPGDLVYSLDDFGEPKLHKLITITYDSREKELICTMWSISWSISKKTFEREIIEREIRSFDGGCPVTSLLFYPLKYYKGGSAQEIEKLCASLKSRGERWNLLASEPPSCKYYNGPAQPTYGVTGVSSMQYVCG